MREITVENLVVGSGAAGFACALRLVQKGCTDTAIVTENVNAGTSRNTGSDKQTYYKLSLAAQRPDSVPQMARDLIAAALAGGRTTCQVGELPLETELSQVFLCIDLDHLPDKEAIAASIEQTLADMVTSTPVEEGRPVHFPGQHMAQVRQENLEQGIPVEESIWEQVRAL